MPKKKVWKYPDPPGGTIEEHSDGSITVDLPGQPKAHFDPNGDPTKAKPRPARIKVGDKVRESVNDKPPYKFIDPDAKPGDETWTEFDPGPPVKLERKGPNGKTKETFDPTTGKRTTKAGGKTTQTNPKAGSPATDDDDLPFGPAPATPGTPGTTPGTPGTTPPGGDAPKPSDAPKDDAPKSGGGGSKEDAPKKKAPKKKVRRTTGRRPRKPPKRSAAARKPKRGAAAKRRPARRRRRG